MNKLRFPPISHFYFFGGGELCLYGIRQLAKRQNIKVSLITGDRFLEEWLPKQSSHFKAAVEKLGINPISFKELGAIPQDAFGILLGTPGELPLDHMRAFEGRFANFHPVPIPQYLGGAHQTWQILQSDRKGSVTFQQCRKTWNEEAILLEIKFRYSARCKTPADYLDFSKKVEQKALALFLSQLENSVPFAVKELDLRHSQYLPHLKTVENGWVDWSWTGKEIKCFITAFDQPYPGASTFIGSQVVRIRGAELNQYKMPFHPFQKGLVVRVTANGIFVRVPEGEIHIREIQDETGAPVTVKPGERLFTPIERLERALQYSPQYKIQREPMHEIQTKRLVLRLLQPSDATSEYVSWLNDPIVNRFIESGNRKHSISTIQQFIEDHSNSNENLLWGIFLKESNRHIGNIKLGPILKRHHRAEVGLLIGERSEWGKGYGKEAIDAVTQYGHQKLHLVKITASVSGRNLPSIHAFKGAGYAEEAKKEKHLFLDGKWDQEILLASFTNGLTSSALKEKSA